MTRTPLFRSVLATCALALSGAAAGAEDRAVVIANHDYARLPDLAGPRPDAAAAAFRRRGYWVAEGRDLSADQIREVLRGLLASDADPGARIVVLTGRFARTGGESWFLGRGAARESPRSLGSAAVPLSVVADLMAGGQGPRVLLLGTDGRAFETGEGVRPSLGAVGGAPGVTVIAGYTDGIARAAAVLARPGGTLAEALAQGQSLRLLSGAQGAAAPPVVAPGPQDAAGDVGAWGRAAALNTLAGYRDYLGKYPQGAFAAEAHRRLAAAPRRLEDVVEPGAEEMAAWTRAKRTNSAQSYAEFLGKWPQSLFAGAARGRMAELQAPAASPGSPAAAEAALNLDRAQRARVQRQLRLLAHDTDGIDGSLGPLTRTAIARFQRNAGAEPTGYLTGAQIDLLARQAGDRARRLEAEARARQAAEAAADRQAWEQNRNRGAAGGRDYLARRPQGLFAAQAQAVLAAAARTDRGEEGAAWARARAAGSAAAWREFLDKYPQSPRAPQARAAIEALQDQSARDRAAEAGLDLAAPVRQAVQLRLQALGLYAGPADGNLGPQTRAALRHYQAARNLRPSGYLNQATMVRLLADTLLGQD